MLVNLYWKVSFNTNILMILPFLFYIKISSLASIQDSARAPVFVALSLIQYKKMAWNTYHSLLNNGRMCLYPRIHTFYAVYIVL